MCHGTALWNKDSQRWYPEDLLVENTGSGTLGNTVSAPAGLPNEEAPCPSRPQGPPLFLAARTCEPEDWNRLGLSAAPSTNLHDSMSTHRPTQRAQSSRRITEPCPDPVTGRAVGEEDYSQGNHITD